MRHDPLQMHWHQIRGHARQWWAELSDDDMEEIQGRRYLLAGFLQRRYGRSAEEAEVDINRFLQRATTLLHLG